MKGKKKMNLLNNSSLDSLAFSSGMGRKGRWNVCVIKERERGLWVREREGRVMAGKNKKRKKGEKKKLREKKR